MSAAQLDEKKVQELEEKFDPEMRFRPVVPPASVLVKWLLVALSCFHYYTAGFGLLRETTHRGIHLAFVLGLIFLVFAANPKSWDKPRRGTWLSPGGVPLIDWLLAIAVAISVLYIPYIFEDLAFRVGNPLPLDVVMGSILVVLLLEATRRSIGWPLPVIALIFMAYALWGRLFPGLLQHSGASWSALVDHLYLTSQGIYGIAVGVVATYVFHFVLFGVLATRIGLGQLFLDIASSIAGRYAGGPAKVSVFASALFGMLSGSSVANAVTVGSLTIPAMVRLGYPRHFAGAVEAASSTGGQITPPVLGAAAFLMVEFLNVPYQTIVVAAIAPAFMHFFGVFMQVHFEAKRTGLRGLRPDELPDLKRSLAERWPTLISLALLIGILVGGFTPYLAAFSGISSCIIVGITTGGGQREAKNYIALAVLHIALGFVIVGASGLDTLPYFLALVILTPFALKKLGIRGKINGNDLLEAFETGAKYALAVGAAAGTVGIVIGVVTLTGVGFKLSYVVTSTAQSIAATLAAVLPSSWVSLSTLALIAALVMTALVCILLGCGVPTTATYIIMVTVAAPTLAQMGVQPLVAHFFVFYYGVLADITPPVAMAAYAAAGMAGSDPFKTGNTAFRLGLGKALVPFVFVFSPALLIVVPGFTIYEFVVTFVGCALGIALLSASLSKFMLVEMRGWERLLAVVAAILMIVPGLTSTLIGCALALPILARHIVTMRRARPA